MEINQTMLQEKWAPVLDSQEAGSITDQHKRRVTAVVLENQEKAVREDRGFILKLHLLTQRALLSITGILY